MARAEIERAGLVAAHNAGVFGTGALERHRESGSPREIPGENGRVESFMKTLKAEEVSLKQYRNLEEARRSIGHFLDEVYNQRRLHSALGYQPPAEFERDWHEQNNKEAAARQHPL